MPVLVCLPGWVGPGPCACALKLDRSPRGKLWMCAGGGKHKFVLGLARVCGFVGCGRGAGCDAHRDLTAHVHVALHRTGSDPYQLARTRNAASRTPSSVQTSKRRVKGALSPVVTHGELGAAHRFSVAPIVLLHALHGCVQATGDVARRAAQVAHHEAAALNAASCAPSAPTTLHRNSSSAGPDTAVRADD
jgi:hypothetical protein